eukprot:TRINITY_DN18306_c0_g1_i1.p2 TRINITY_DN18306_c0_g1~~TRINITY_DN18306_c0_g1_i1.p2  ORF type:complete len:223 (+),score=77.30 TRINITY_DN18306_c0_g1_i1:60-671(+)
MGAARLLAAAVFVAAAQASTEFGRLTLRLEAHREECFYDEASRVGEKGFLHFQVTSGGALDVDVSIHAPDDRVIWSAERETENRVLFKTTHPGVYRFCFSNKMSTRTYKTVSFDLAVGDPTEVTKDHAVDPIESSIVRVSEGLNEIKQEQEYMRVRERIHRDTAEETNFRVLWFSLFEVALLLTMGVGQVVYLKRQFEVRRHV